MLMFAARWCLLSIPAPRYEKASIFQEAKDSFGFIEVFEGS
jgi:hypothetical protein